MVDKWARARVRVDSFGRDAVPIGAGVDALPDFLRRLPPGSGLAVAVDVPLRVMRALKVA